MLPSALKPLSNSTLACLAVLLIILLCLQGCGGGRADDPEQRKDDPSPNCAMRSEVCK